MLCSGTDPESYITEYTLVYEDRKIGIRRLKNSIYEDKKIVYEDKKTGFRV